MADTSDHPTPPCPSCLHLGTTKAMHSRYDLYYCDPFVIAHPQGGTKTQIGHLVRSPHDRPSNQLTAARLAYYRKASRS